MFVELITLVTVTEVNPLCDFRALEVFDIVVVISPPPQSSGCMIYAIVMSFCLSVR